MKLQNDTHFDELIREFSNLIVVHTLTRLGAGKVDELTKPTGEVDDSINTNIRAVMAINIAQGMVAVVDRLKEVHKTLSAEYEVRFDEILSKDFEEASLQLVEKYGPVDPDYTQEELLERFKECLSEQPLVT